MLFFYIYLFFLLWPGYDTVIQWRMEGEIKCDYSAVFEIIKSMENSIEIISLVISFFKVHFLNETFISNYYSDFPARI